jgi:hypothetical protein
MVSGCGDRRYRAEIVLVGVIHGDPEGYDRLKALLRREDPSLVTLEFSEFGLRFRREKAATIRENLRCLLLEIGLDEDAIRATFRRGGPGGLTALLDFPYEYLAARDFCAERGRPLSLIDLSRFSEQKLRILEEEALQPENIRALLDRKDSDMREEVKKQRRMAERCLAGGADFAFLRSAGLAEELRIRDQYMAEEIRRRAEASPGAMLMHIGGWEHLVASKDVPSLTQVLRDMRPHTIYLLSS